VLLQEQDVIERDEILGPCRVSFSQSACYSGPGRRPALPGYWLCKPRWPWGEQGPYDLSGAGWWGGVAPSVTERADDV
jgi:hypothetical protein